MFSSLYYAKFLSEITKIWSPHSIYWNNFNTIIHSMILSKGAPILDYVSSTSWSRGFIPKGVWDKRPNVDAQKGLRGMDTVRLRTSRAVLQSHIHFKEPINLEERSEEECSARDCIKNPKEIYGSIVPQCQFSIIAIRSKMKFKIDIVYNLGCVRTLQYHKP